MNLSSVRALHRRLRSRTSLKYHNQRVKCDGVTFDSKKEFHRYGQLKWLEQAGQIHLLRVHPRFPLRVKHVMVCTYVADFAYVTLPEGVNVVEDVKGLKTPVYQLKKKLMQACLGITIQEK